MKQLNNKGFAISSLLYGIMIMAFLIVFALMSTMGTNRKNTATLVDKIEDELNRYSLTSTTGYNTGSTTDSSGREYIVPSNGWYKIELWGAAGGGTSSYLGGKGAYTSGIIYLEENDRLYFYLGKKGAKSEDGFNGGGKGKGSAYDGGGATDVRLVSGAWNDTTSLNHRIMVAAGGSGATSAKSGVDGGTIIGNKVAGTAGDQGSKSTLFGISSDASKNNSGGGGGGYYSGTAGDGGPGASGSSFIMGYAGVRATESDGKPSTNTNKSFTITRGKYDSNGNAVKETVTPVFYNGLMVPGVNSSTGKFAINKISDNNKNTPPTIIKSNTKLKEVKYIRDCITSSNKSNYAHWTEIEAISGGKRQPLSFVKAVEAEKTISIEDQNKIIDGIVDNVDNGKFITIKSDSNSTKKCVTVQLKSNTNLDEIAIWHYYEDSRSYKSETIEVWNDSSTNKHTILRKEYDKDKINEKETPNGIRYSIFLPDSIDSLPDGNYYIFPSSSINKVVTKTSSDFSLRLFKSNDSNIQKWYISKVNSYYRIIDSKTNKAIGVNGTGTSLTFNTNNPGDATQNWTIVPLGNGYYQIQTANKYNGTYKYLTGANSSDIECELRLVTLASTKQEQRFKFIPSDY